MPILNFQFNIHSSLVPRKSHLVIPLNPSKHRIVLILAGRVFQWYLFPHREEFHIVHVQYPSHVLMAFEVDSEEIIRLALHPISRFEYMSQAMDMWITYRKERFKTYTNIVCPAM